MSESDPQEQQRRKNSERAWNDLYSRTWEEIAAPGPEDTPIWPDLADEGDDDSPFPEDFSFDTPALEEENYSEALDAFAQSQEDTPEPPSEPPGRAMQQTISLLLSVVLNFIIFIALALLLIPLGSKPPVLVAVFSDRIGDQLDTLTEDEGNLNPVKADEPFSELTEDVRVDDVNVFELEEKEFRDNAAAPFFDQSRIDIRDLLRGRTDPGLKDDLLSKYGGTVQTREAVRRGLLWMVKQQQKNGSWSLKEPYRDGITKTFVDNKTAASGLALLALEGDGNTRWEGEHKNAVKKGWQWLLKQQNEDGSFFGCAKQGEVSSSGGRFYTQAVVTIALCELIVMERSSGRSDDLRTVAQKSVDYLVKWQNRELGGWRYDEGIGSDLSVTGWCTMALQTARAAELYVPQETLDRISSFLDSVAYDEGAQYCYSPTSREKRPSMTATGLLCREYLGWDRKNPALLAGAEILTRPENLVRYEDPQKADRQPGMALFQTNVYGWYSAAMMLKHLGPYNKYWQTWNKAMSAEIPARQCPEGNSEAGSWDPDLDSYRFGGGRLYVTALSILCLEVYYRHLSLYTQTTQDP
ncbi:MAG: terpene cyclase/mutase family protein [Thermoguttaceae bacterium]|nr:terpene cyclase/mutase family protein [Thermoguttaceae bacterium]